MRELIIIVSVASGNALTKITSLQGTDEDETGKGKEKVSREGRTEDEQAFEKVESVVRCTYRFDGGLVNFAFSLPQMMPIY